MNDLSEISQFLCPLKKNWLWFGFNFVLVEEQPNHVSFIKIDRLDRPFITALDLVALGSRLGLSSVICFSTFTHLSNYCYRNIDCWFWLSWSKIHHPENRWTPENSKIRYPPVIEFIRFITIISPKINEPCPSPNGIMFGNRGCLTYYLANMLWNSARLVMKV